MPRVSSSARTVVRSAAQSADGADAAVAAVARRSGAAPRRPRSLASGLVDSLTEAIRSGRLAAGAQLPTESALTERFGVSRTVVREAISKLQAAGLVRTRHGIGTFVIGPGDSTVFRVRPAELETLADVLAVLELRLAVESEAAGLAAERRTPAQLRRLRAAMDRFDRAAADGRDAVDADVALHAEIARATGNPHFESVWTALGTAAIPRARLPGGGADAKQLRAYLQSVHDEHRRIVQAIADGDADAARAAMRVHLGNSLERRRRAGLMTRGG